MARAILQRSVLISAAIVLVLVVANGLVFARNIARLRDGSRQVIHTQQVLAAIDTVLITTDDAESGQRGYLLTGRPPYLEPYTAATGRINSDIARLRDLTQDNPAQQQRVGMLQQQSDMKFAELAETVASRQRGDTDAALQIVLTGRGRQYMDAIRTTLAAMTGEEEQLLVNRSAAADRQTRTAVVTLLVASLLDVALLIGALLLVQRTIAEQQRAAAERHELLKQERAARAEAEAALATRDTFLSVAAHELRGPLTALLGHAQLLERRAARDSALEEAPLRSIGTVVRQARRLGRLIDALLDVSRIQLGQLTIMRAPMDLVELTRGIVDEMRPTTEQHTIVGVYPNAPIAINGDADRLAQVIQNLLQNAIRYSPDGGEITVTVTVDGEMGCVAVADCGIGIPASALPQIFERFHRVTNARTQEVKGMGIGLFVVKEIVGLHGGTVAVESREGSGSTLVF